MHSSRKFCQRDPAMITFCFLVYEGREDPNTTISGPSSCQRWPRCQRLPNIERWLGSLVGF